MAECKAVIVENVLDFSRSFVTFFTRPHQGANIARIQLDATCRVVGWGHEGGPVDYHLIAPCRSEQMYREGQLFQLPNYEFSGIFTEDDLLLLRTHWTSDQDHHEYARTEERFERVAIDRTPMRAERLETEAAIVQATLANRRLVARTTLPNQDSGQAAVLEYPIKTMNVVADPPRYQVDTGPLLVPLFQSVAEEPIRRLAVAHIVYCLPDRAEFILRVPHPVGESDAGPVNVTDYSELHFSAAQHEIWGEIQ